MTKTKKFHTLEYHVRRLQQEAQHKHLSIERILQIVSGKGKPLILILLALPFCQPIQIPGLSTPFGLVIAFIGLRMAFGKKIWFPHKIRKTHVSSKALKRITTAILKLAKKLKRWIHPRLLGVCHLPWMEVINGLAVCLLGIILALPLPIPLSNVIAAWALLLFGLGMLEDDGLFILLGYLLCFVILAFLAVIPFFLKNFFHEHPL